MWASQRCAAQHTDRSCIFRSDGYWLLTMLFASPEEWYADEPGWKPSIEAKKKDRIDNSVLKAWPKTTERPVIIHIPDKSPAVSFWCSALLGSRSKNSAWLNILTLLLDEAPAGSFMMPTMFCTHRFRKTQAVVTYRSWAVQFGVLQKHNHKQSWRKHSCLVLLLIVVLCLVHCLLWAIENDGMRHRRKKENEFQTATIRKIQPAHPLRFCL